MDNEMMSQHAKRAALMVQMLSPPLPMMCTGSAEGRSFTSSHDLIWSITGRLVGVPAEAFGRGIPGSGYAGSDWMRHILEGPHTRELLETLAGMENTLHTDAASMEAMYQAFCRHTRAIVALAVRYDMLCCGAAAGGAPPGDLDIRFLADVGRVSVPRDTKLVVACVDFYCSQLVLRAGMDSDAVACARASIRDYRRALVMSMELVRAVSKRLLKELKPQQPR